MKVGIQGQQGSYHEAAALQYFGELSQSRLDYVDTFPELFAKVQSQELGAALVAIANNRYGFIQEPYSQITKPDNGLWVAGEVYTRVEHQLLGVAGTTLDAIEEVHSQAPALGQCTQFLHEKLSRVPHIEQEDTALSAELIAKWGNPSKVAIASSRAAEIYGLKIVAPNIQDDKDNITRFLILEPRDGQAARDHNDKTTAMLRIGQAPGSLADVLIQFKEQGINISTLHSSFLPNTGFDMQFLIDFDAGFNDPKVKTVLEGLNNLGAGLLVLGSYKKAEMPLTQR